MNYLDLLFEETASYIMCRREDINAESELGAAFFAVWNLISPIHNKLSIGTECDFDIVLENFPIRFSAHAHPSEPLTPSPDDIALCSEMGSDMAHFITDRFLCVRFM